MCGRFTATFTFRDLKIRFNLQEALPEFAPRYNIAPTQSAMVVTLGNGNNDAEMMRWGLVPSWAKDIAIGNRMINARAETLAGKSSFKPLVERRRCLIPADGFYEWRHEGKRKVPVWIHLRNKEPFAFAGLWEVWKQPNGEKLQSFTIVTCPANELLQPIHDRMPVILRPQDETAWLDTDQTRWAQAKKLLAPFAAQSMQFHDVAKLVNSPAHDQPACIWPALGEAEELPLFR